MASIDTINKQRAKAGATPIATKQVDASGRTWSYTDPVGTSSRSAQQNAQQQNQNVATKGVRSGSNPNADIVEQTVQQNFTLPGSGEGNELTPEEYESHLKGIQLAEGSKYVQQPQKKVYSSVTPTQKTTTETMNDRISQRRLRRLSEQGVMEQDANTIDEIMNKGGEIGGEENGRTFFLMPDGSKVFSPVNTTATRATVDIAGTDFKTEIGEEDEAAKNSQKETFIQKNKEQKQPEKTPMTSIPQIDSTIANLEGLTAEKMGVRQDVFNAFTPLITQQLNAAYNARTRAEEIDTAEERAAIAEDQIAPEKALAAQRESQLTARHNADLKFLQENRDIVAEQNRLLGEAVDLDKQLFEEEARISEIRQMAANVEGEKRLRRSLNALGVENSPAATDFLQTKINEAADSLESMIRTNNLSALKFTNARQQLDLGLRQALTKFESDRAALNATFDDNIFNLDEFVSGARSEVLSELKDEWKTLIEKEDEMMIAAATSIQTMTMESLKLQQEEEVAQQKKESDELTLLSNTFQDFLPGSDQRKWALDRAKKAGIDVTGWDIDSMTTAQLNKQKNEGISESITGNYGTFIDPSTDADLVTLISRSTLGQGGTEGERLSQQETMLHFLKNGDIDLYEDELFNAATNSLEKKLGAEDGSITSGIISYNQLETVISTYENFTDEQKASVNSILGKKLVDVNKWINNPNNADLIDFVSKVGYFVAAKRKQLFGASLTGNEKVSAADFLPNAREQSIEDTMTQIESLRGEIENELISKYGTQLGDRDYAKKLVEQKILNSGNDEYKRNSNTDDAFKSSVNSINGSIMINGSPINFEPTSTPDVSQVKVGDKVVSRMMSGTVTTLHDQGSDWTYGVDIAPSGSRAIIADRDAEVINIIDGFENKTGKPLANGMSQNGGFGNQVVLKYSDGKIAYISHIDGGSFKVKKGQKITAGQSIAMAGNTGKTGGVTGIHIDYTLAKAGADPFKLPSSQKDLLYGNEFAASFIDLRKTT